MASVVDTLVIALGYDVSGLERGSKQAREDLTKLDKDAQRLAKEMEATGKQAAAFFIEVRNQALALAATLMGGLGLKEFASQTTHADAATARLAKNLDMSAQDLKAWEGAARRAGSSAESMDSALVAIRDSVQALMNGQGVEGPAKYFSQLGVDIHKANGELKNSGEILLDMSAGIERLAKTDPQRAAYIGKAIFGDENLGVMLSQGPRKLQEILDHVREIRQHANAAAEAAVKLAQAWEDLQDESRDLADALLVKLAPALLEILKDLQGLAKWAADHPDVSAAFVGLAGALTALGTASALASGASGLAKLVPGFAGIAAAAGAATTAVWTLGAALAGAAGAGVGTLAWNKVLAGTSFGDWLGAALHGDIGGARRDQYDPNANPMTITRAGGSAGSGSTRGIRNNNPGNIKSGSFATSVGATGQDAQGFAIFPDMATGIRATTSLLGNYFRKGWNTVESAVSHWAPSSENNTATYIADLARGLGVSSGQKLTEAQMAQLAPLIFSHENGSRYLAGIMNAAGGGRSAGSGGDTYVSGPINVYTQATDAKGVARGIKGALQSKDLTAQANTGLRQ